MGDFQFTVVYFSCLKFTVYSFLTKLCPALPKYIHNIVGLSVVRGRMYLQDTSGNAFFSSNDGRRMDSVDPSLMEQVRPAMFRRFIANISKLWLQVLNSTSFVPAINIPGDRYQDINDKEIMWPNSTVEGEN